MPDRVTPADPGLLASLADEVSLPGYAVRNLIRGDFGAAARNAADFGLNLADAALPGDWIPEVSASEDRPEFSDVFGTPDGALGDVVNFAGNVLTDPLTFVPGAAVAKGAGAAAKGVKAVTPKIVQEGIAKVAKPAGKLLRKVAGAEKIGKGLKGVVTAAQGAKEVTARAGADALTEALKGATPRELEAIGEVSLNVTRDKATGALRAIDDSDTLAIQERLARYMTENPDLDPQRLAELVAKTQGISKAQWESGKAAGTAGGNIFTDIPGAANQQGIRDYFPRIFKNEDPDIGLDDLLGQPSAIKGRKLETTKDVLSYLAENPNVQLTTNAAEALSQRAGQQAELASRGAAGRGLFELAKQSNMVFPEELLSKAAERQRMAQSASRPAPTPAAPSPMVPPQPVAVADKMADQPLNVGQASVRAKPPADIANETIPEVIGPELGIEKAARTAMDRATMTGDDFAKLAEEARTTEEVLAKKILGPELGETWAKRQLDETWIEKQIDAGRVAGIPPGTPYEQWWPKVEPLFQLDDFRELRNMSRKIKDIEAAATPEELGQFMAGDRLYDLMNALRREPGQRMLFSESEAVTMYNAIKRVAAARGWDEASINKGMYEATFAAGYKPEDIADLLHNTSQKMGGGGLGGGAARSIESSAPPPEAFARAAQPRLTHAPESSGTGSAPMPPPAAQGFRATPSPASPPQAAASGLSSEERMGAREWLLSQDYKQADPLLREAAETIAKNLPGDEADVALHFLKGMKARTGLAKGLAALNSKFKPVAVYGALIPKLGSITRNMTGAVWQKFSNPEARGSISPKNIPTFMRDWLASIEDGVERLFGKRVFTKNEFAEMDDAFKASGGDPRKALALIKDPTMRAAAERGVFGNNFVDTEKLIAEASKTGLRNFGAKVWDYPGYMFKGAEQRMRYGLFKDLVKKGKSPDEAASVVRDSFYDYSISGVENRLARDIIPFGQFLFKSVPAQAKLMAEKPYLASGLANLYAQGRDEPVLPSMEGKVNIPIGEDEQGNRQYISNLGLPFEALATLPNLSANPLQAGRDIEQNLVGSTSPLIKAAYAYTSGRDPYFGSTPGSYTKIAGQDLGQAGSILNQLIGTGLSPLVAAQQLAGQASRLTDDRTSLGETAANFLTGVRVQSVDPDRAIQQRLQAFLERDPSIGQSRTFYDKGDDVDAQELLRNLQEARKALKEKAKAAANVN